MNALHRISGSVRPSRRVNSTKRAPRIETLEGRELMAAGALDLSFDQVSALHKGVAVSDLNGFDEASAIALQPDGKIVVAGLSKAGLSCAVARYNYNGTLDTSFGAGGSGFVIFDFHRFNDPSVYISQAFGVAVQADGKIVVAGSAWKNGTTETDIGLTRLQPNGAIDLNFGAVGFTIASISPMADIPSSIALQADGKIVVAGTTQTTANDYDMFVARFTAGGFLDSTFGSGGRTLLDFQGYDKASAVAVQPDGKVVIAGTGTYQGHTDFVVARFTTTGAADTTFGTPKPGQSKRTGWTLTDLFGGDDGASSLAIQPDGKIVAAGSAAYLGSTIEAVVRYTSQGDLDSSFSGDGKQFLSFLPQASSASGVALQRDGKIVVVGSAGDNVNRDITLRRLNSDGSYDNTFIPVSPKGNFRLDVGFNDVGNAVAVQPNGRIVVAGLTQPSAGAGDFLVARYLDGRLLQSDYNGDGKADPAVYGTQNAAWSYQAIVGVKPIYPLKPTFGSPNLSAQIPVPADYDGDGLTDQAIFIPKTATWIISYRAGGVRIVNFGAQNLADIPVPADFDGDGKADLAVFRVSTAQWFIAGQAQPMQFGDKNLKDIPVPADFDGDGKADLALYRVSTGQWIIRDSGSPQVVIRNSKEFVPNLGTIPVPADYNGDGKAELAVFRVADARWRGYDLSGNLVFNATFGKPNLADLPLEASIASLRKLKKV